MGGGPTRGEPTSLHVKTSSTQTSLGLGWREETSKAGCPVAAETLPAHFWWGEDQVICATAPDTGVLAYGIPTEGL